MKKLVGLSLALCIVSGANAQAQGWQRWADQAISASIAVAQRLLARVNREGRPLAEKMLKAAPDYYRSSQKSLQAFIKRVDQADIPTTFREKQQFILELWRLRGAINVLALSDPEVVKNLLNLEPSVVQKMQKDFRQTETKLKKANMAGI